MKRHQIMGVGNALVDVLAHCDDAFLAANKVEKGVMTLIDAARGVALYNNMGPAQEISGGSAANTIAGLAALGARAAYVGKVKDDQLGRIFAHDIRSLGVSYETPMTPAEHQADETGRCLVLVTPDGERSMSTYLGVSAALGPNDIDEGAAADSEWLYLEGYRFDGPESHAAFAKTIAAVKAGGGKISLTLSDPFCVDRHYEAFRKMIREDVDLLFANAAELKALYRTDDLDAALKDAREEIALTACTVSENGVRIASAAGIEHAPAETVKLVDATGAGDMFAAGFLYGLVNGRDHVTCGRMGCVAASEIISHMGARPEADLKALFREKGLL